MRFVVDSRVFEKLDNVCFGVVIAKGVSKYPHDEIAALLNQSVRTVEDKFSKVKAKESAPIVHYREAFRELGMNPNKYMSSIEAMVTRIEKKKGFPHINPLVDLGNAISLKHLVPLGAHDLDVASGDICVRFARAGDTFIPFGEQASEQVDEGELIYSVGDIVKTRRWIWRQSEEGKVTDQSKNIFFPIDGFTDINLAQVLAARDELAELLVKHFGCKVITGFVDNNHSVLNF
ncbi:hypothetical protein SCACP_23350 [Sporomusa carbonis]|uniref:B3/B4 domain-containing protein n=1 Tax=Sporomusa carbonis TaxID=3076075 RepID=UPI003A607AC2